MFDKHIIIMVVRVRFLQRNVDEVVVWRKVFEAGTVVRLDPTNSGVVGIPDLTAASACVPVTKRRHWQRNNRIMSPNKSVELCSSRNHQLGNPDRGVVAPDSWLTESDERSDGGLELVQKLVGACGSECAA